MKCINCKSEIPKDAICCKVCGTIYDNNRKIKTLSVWLVFCMLIFMTCACTVFCLIYAQGPFSDEIILDKQETITEKNDVPINVNTENVTELEESASNMDIYVETELLEPQTKLPEVEMDEFVRVQDYIPSLFVDLKYATTDNFTGKIIYDFTDAYLRYGTVKKLMCVQELLEDSGYSLKIWDAYRPVSAQFVLWDTCPDSAYVANPNKGYSSHSKGNTVDVTIVEADGTEVEMPTGFDDFSKLADRDYSDCTQESRINATFLQDLMIANGFEGYSEEWWHYTDVESYEVEKEFSP